MIRSDNLYALFAGFLLFTAACTAEHLGGSTLPASSPSGLKLLSISDLVYEGAFRVPEHPNGVSSMNFSEGPIAYDAGAHSIFLVGHSHQQAIAEYAAPDIRPSRDVASLEMAQQAAQVFSTVLDRMSGGNPENLNRIGGLARHDGQLLISAYDYYDAPTDNYTTHLVLQNARDLAGSAVTGPLSFRGRAHTAGWMSPIPDELQGALGGTWLTGNSSGQPIIGRLSVGPSAFAFNPGDMNKSGTVRTTTLLDFSLAKPLHGDLFNEKGDNNIWTHLSRTVHGFIPPGTRTYITLGQSGGHQSSVCYKCIPAGLTANCSGYCAKDPDDYYLMYWLWDVLDLIDVRRGAKQPNSVRPYDYGLFLAPFPGIRFGGGSYDPASNRLYLTLQRADHDQGSYSNPPVILVYSVATSDRDSNTSGNK